MSLYALRSTRSLVKLFKVEVARMQLVYLQICQQGTRCDRCDVVTTCLLVQMGRLNGSLKHYISCVKLLHTKEIFLDSYVGI